MLKATGLAERPLATAALGAMCIASSGVLVRLADTSPVTVAVFRCLFALPVLGAITYFESKRLGPLPSKARNYSWIAGLFFALDLIFWHHAIEAVGAGLATVLGNLQVLIVGFVAWGLLKEKPPKTLFIAVPVVLGGVVLISGIVGEGAYGKDPVLGVVLGLATSLAYAGFILTLRQGSGDLARIAGPLFHATLIAAISSAIFGALDGTLDYNPGPASLGWLLVLALTSQVAGWLLIARSLPRLPAAITSVTLLLQPVGAMTLAAIVLEEDPSPAQIAGAVAILAGVVIATAGHRGRVPTPAA